MQIHDIVTIVIHCKLMLLLTSSGTINSEPEYTRLC